MGMLLLFLYCLKNDLHIFSPSLTAVTPFHYPADIYAQRLLSVENSAVRAVSWCPGNDFFLAVGKSLYLQERGVNGQ